MKKKIILLRDPWKDVKNKDSGWGNRLICWEAAHIINKALGGDYIIKVLPAEYPEILAVNFPNTEYYTPNEWSKDLVPIENSTVLSWIEKDEITLSNDVSYVTNFDFSFSGEITGAFFNFKFDLVRKLRFKDEALGKRLRLYFKDRIGIHIRRGRGVHMTNDDKLSIPKPYMRYYKVCTKCDKNYPFIRDEIYFNIIEDYIKKDKDAKFFIGIDINEKALIYYKEKYPGRIITFEDVVKDNKDVIDQSQILRPRLQLSDMGKILIDFFSLAYCKVLMGSPSSTWSYMAFRILNNSIENKMTTYIPSEELRKPIGYLNVFNYNGHKKQYIHKSDIL